MAFSSPEREKLKWLNDAVCQRHNCHVRSNLTVHHLIPECLGSMEVTLSEQMSDEYVFYFYTRLQECLSEVEQLRHKDFFRALSHELGRSHNGIVLCQDCHRTLHEETFSPSSLKLKRNSEVFFRPQSLDPEDILPLFYHVMAVVLKEVKRPQNVAVR